MGVLTKAQIVEARDLATEEIEVPEWGGSVIVRALSGSERDRFEAAITRGKGKDVTVNMENVRARLAAASIVDENGARMFSDEEIEALGGKSAMALDRVFKAAQRLSGLAPEDVEELAGN